MNASGFTQILLIAGCLALASAASGLPTPPQPQTMTAGAAHSVDGYMCASRSPSSTLHTPLEVPSGSRKPVLRALRAHIERTSEVPQQIRCRYTGSHGGNRAVDNIH